MSKDGLTNREYRICTKCVMDTTDPDIEFDENGVCSHCRRYDEFIKTLPVGEEKEKELYRIITEIKKWGEGRDYDCILGISGGVDSSYVAYKAKEFGLRPLVVHFDSGWNSEISVRNIENIVRKLGFDLYTYVVDWEEMKDLQLAYLKASVINADIPQDYAFLTVLYKIAAEKGIKYFISGYNYQTEFILPAGWGYPPRDTRNIVSIHKKYGSRPLKAYPILNPLIYLYYSYFRIKRIDLLCYMQFNKNEAMGILEDRLGWKYYGGKHYESIWTRFYQGYYLPVKFKVDKRRAHLASLVVSGQMTREDALEELKNDPYPAGLLETDTEFIIKKLGITKEKFEEIMGSKPRSHMEFSTGKCTNFLVKIIISFIFLNSKLKKRLKN